MRQIRVGVCTSVLMFLLVSFAIGRGPSTSSSQFTEDKLSLIEENLIIGLTDNTRPILQASAASVLRQVKSLAPEYSFSSSIIPLMAIVKDEKEYEPTRILAALALHSLNSERGEFAIKMTAKFTGQERLRKVLEALSSETQ